MPEMLGFHGEYPLIHLKAKFWSFLVKNCKKSAVKHSLEKPIFLNFLNLSPTFCPILSHENDFYLTGSRPLEFIFFEDFSILTVPFPLQIGI